MNPMQLLEWQWSGYPRYHRNRVSLLLHMVMVPMFDIGTLLAAAGLLLWSPWYAVTGVACMVASMLVQGRAHRLETVPPEPFTGPGNFIGRLLLEQWVNFPRFVLTGGWSRNLKAADAR
jgi:hypothetical protein